MKQTRGTIALMHFTSGPVIGGVESFVWSQAQTLLRMGYGVRLVVGQGDAPRGAELRLLDGMCPREARAAEDGSDWWFDGSSRGSDAVEQLVQEVSHALRGCSECWVHNIFTVDLHPVLTAALVTVAHSMADIRWVAWCEDLTATSAVASPRLSDRLRQSVSELLRSVTVVTISSHRRAEMCRVHQMALEAVRVIPPPVDAFAWLDLSEETRRFLHDSEAGGRAPIVLVPSKFLPHKNLECVLDLAEELVVRGYRPRVVLTAAFSSHEPQTSRRLFQEFESGAVSRHLTEHLCFVEPNGGGVSARRVRELMQVADFVFLPSYEEGYGMPAVEAAITRTPVLCSDIPAFRESARENGWFFGLNAGIEHTADQAEEIMRLPANVARRRAIRSLFDFELQLRNLLDDPLPETVGYVDIRRDG